MFKVSISKEDLAAALREWERMARTGQTRTPEAARALPAEQVVAENTAHLWRLLTEPRR